MIGLLCALPAEARPLIARLRLKNAGVVGGWRFHAGDGLCLVTSGVGVARAAGAAALLGARLPPHSGWLNVGIAGHASRPIGSAALAAKVTDAASGALWYPQFAFGCVAERLPLTTVAIPTVPQAGSDALLDMEAAGCFAVATRYTTLERLHSFKVVSDNLAYPAVGAAASPAAAPTSAAVSELIEAQLDLLLEFIERLRALPGAAPIGEELLERYIGGRRCSQSQRHQLARLLERWQALRGALPAPPVGQAGSLRTCLVRWQRELDRAARAHPLGSRR